MEEILVYLSIIHNGDWNKIYQDIIDKRSIDVNTANDTLKNIDISYLTILSKNYPDCLKQTFKPPFVLYYKGNIELLDKSLKKVALIGSRDNSDYGKHSTETICSGLVKENIVIVSGLAKGIDALAHKNCLNNKGKTIAILGNGLNIQYPKENKQLYDQIEKEGLLLSEYPPDTAPDSKNFPKRNRIISAISDGIVVIEAKEKSGTMNTVAHALEDGKPIFCVPDRANNNSGCNKLIKEGAKLVETVQDILEDL